MDYLPLISLILGLLALLFSVAALVIFQRAATARKTFFSGKTGAQLEDFIVNQNKKINELAGRSSDIEEALASLQEKQKLAIQKMGVVRYNPFDDNGGNLSFSIALLDEHDNGVIITSMHGRDANRVYAKPVKKGGSEFPLTNEEKQAIKESKIINQLK